jgi:hypothetical protein
MAEKYWGVTQRASTKARTRTFQRMNSTIQFENRASRSRSKHEGESSVILCDRLSRTRDISQRQLPTDHDYAVSTREYQTDQSSLKPAPTAAGPVLGRQKSKKKQQKPPHRSAAIDGVTPYQDKLRPRLVIGLDGDLGLAPIVAGPVLNSTEVEKPAFAKKSSEPSSDQRLSGEHFGLYPVYTNLYSEPKLLPPARMKDKCRAEARDASSGMVTHARVRDAIRSFEEKLVRKRLRGAVALGNWIGLQAVLPLGSIELVKRT